MKTGGYIPSGYVRWLGALFCQATMLPLQHLQFPQWPLNPVGCVITRFMENVKVEIYKSSLAVICLRMQGPDQETPTVWLHFIASRHGLFPKISQELAKIMGM
ncbi:hypothetical protein EFE41_03290 [Methanohalophilus portucalensis FDF-1]|uniref:Uncharacterized protein n=3 Tax=Methanohalophilus portucalensis TaxID=39664 RepID=A0A3M9LK00_9EURY|nr:hypothetical protein BKM01_05235 [Methanohalophilus portucalensis]RNI13612.1 hypothetical protein EFE41_03290 [Methanohalophilus portucalensis FDF-1]